MSARVPFDNNTNVISKAVLHTPNEPRFGDSIDVCFEDQQEVHRSKFQSVNTAKQSAISERLVSMVVFARTFETQLSLKRLTICTIQIFKFFGLTLDQKDSPEEFLVS